MNPPDADLRDLGRTITVYCLSMHLYPWGGKVVSKHLLVSAESLHYFAGGPAGYIGVVAHEMDKELRDTIGEIPRSREWEMGLVPVM